MHCAGEEMTVSSANPELQSFLVTLVGFHSVLWGGSNKSIRQDQDCIWERHTTMMHLYITCTSQRGKLAMP